MKDDVRVKFWKEGTCEQNIANKGDKGLFLIAGGKFWEGLGQVPEVGAVVGPRAVVGRSSLVVRIWVFVGGRFV